MKHLLLLCLSLLTGMLYADNVPLNQAQALATDFFKVNVHTRNVSPHLKLVWDGEDAQTRSADVIPAFYVFNSTDGNGFVIVSGEDTTFPILGYSYTNDFKVEGMPDNVRSWMNGLRAQINAVRADNIEPSLTTTEAWRRTTNNSIGGEVLLNTADWDQTAPYNNLCPKIGAVTTVTGCVPTALAILMKYHEWPDKGEGTIPGYEYYIEGNRQSISARELGHTYNWDKMPLAYTRGETAEAQTEVATLIYDCGVMSQAQYNTSGNGGTGAVTQTAVHGLITYMQYDKGAKFLMREWYSDAEWHEILKEEIAAGRPILYGGANNKSEGHQFILDGYNSDNYFAVNWGWSGYGNGYYLLSSLEPTSQGVGGNSGGGFVVGQDAVLGIKKAQASSAYIETLVLMPGSNGQTMYYGLSTSETDFQPNKKFTMSIAYLFNMGFQVFNGNAILSLIDKDGRLKEDISSTLKLKDIAPGRGGRSNLSCEITKTLSGGDRICVRYKSSESTEWQKILSAGGAISEIVVKEEPTAIARTGAGQAITVFVEQEQVMVHSPTSINEVVLYDLDGKILQKIPAKQNMHFSFTMVGYPAGVYILQVRTEKGTESHKIVKK